MAKQPINVAASVIADISAGIYRSPAGALKELVSNAFDADALTVRVSTGWPKFKTFTCTDDGRGMTPDDFKRVMGHIGGSSKRDAGELSPKRNRPLIGRIGIGLLSIAQICRHFTVISSAEGIKQKFRADIDLEPYLLAEARRKRLGQTVDTAEGKVKIGEYDIEEAEEVPDKHYTRIVMERIDEGFQQRLTDQPQKRGGLNPKVFTAGTIEDFLKIVETGTVAEHGAYAQLIWELAITAPIEYMDRGPFRPGNDVDDRCMAQIKERLAGYRFKAYLDGVELRKPTLLPQAQARRLERKVYPIQHTKTLSSGRSLVVNGYLYWQKGRILPRELQGVLVRVRNVAVGQYDPTYLGYPHHEGFKFSQMTGELYVDDGLDQAVNIDRASFRESDEGFIELQSYLFEKLKGGADEGAGVFTDIKKVTGKLRKQARAREEVRRARFAGRLTGRGNRRMVFETIAEERVPSGVEIEHGIVRVEGALINRVPRRQQQLYAAVCGILERELSSLMAKERRKRLYARIAELLEGFK